MRHHNNYPYCPVIGAGDTSGRETYVFMFLEWDIIKALEIITKAKRKPVTVPLSRVSFDMNYWNPKHVDHVPSDKEKPCITIPIIEIEPVIDGTHRAQKAKNNGALTLNVYQLTGKESLACLTCPSMVERLKDIENKEIKRRKTK